MAAYTDGFSQRDSNIEIGHLLGLRWFQLDASSQACNGLSYHREQLDITALEDPHQIQVPGDITITCSCGAVARRSSWGSGDRLDVFIKEHEPQARHSPVPILRGARDAWQPGENEARCLTRDARFPPFVADPLAGEAHDVPVRSCGCGFWAYWELGDQMTGDPAIVAIVKGYGAVIEGDKGFRCSHASVEALHLPYWDQTSALALEDRYGVPVYSNLQAMLAMHKAPEGQPELRDAHFAAARGGSTWVTMWAGGSGGSAYAAGGLVGGGGGSWSAPMNVTSVTVNPPHQGGKTAAAMKAAAVPCNGCNLQACATNQLLCASCQALDDAKYQAPTPSVAGAVAPAHKQPASVTGIDAVAQLHARREAWAKASGSLKAATETLSAVNKRAVEQMRELAEYITKTCGDEPKA